VVTDRAFYAFSPALSQRAREISGIAICDRTHYLTKFFGRTTCPFFSAPTRWQAYKLPGRSQTGGTGGGGSPCRDRKCI